jgi:hypothetical protein
MAREVRGLLIAILIGLILGGLVVQRWHSQDFPRHAVYIEIKNTLSEVVPLVRVEHGSDFLQERILLTQLQPNEARLITLNHELGQGFTVEAQFSDGEKTDACVGRMASRWVEHLEIGKSGIRALD